MSDQDERPSPSSTAETPTTARVSRRRFLRTTSVGGAAVALAACQTAAPEAASTAVPSASPAAPSPAAVASASAAPASSAAPVDNTARGVSSLLQSDLLPYPRAKVGTLADLGSGAFSATYPDANSPIQIIKLGSAVSGGVGSDGDIVAYSALCTHMGCPVGYDAATNVFQCPCHFSQFDVARDAMLVNGPATQHLPRVALEIEGQDIYAIGVQGLIYGRPHNLSLTEGA
jgi:arsenite oxidase small subunit